MSAFDTNAGTTALADPITEDFLGNLVGEGKKFTDAEALARGKYEADLHVTGLEKQLAELREDLDQGSKITELMELVRNQNKPQDPPTPPKEGPGDTSSGQMTEEELKALIETHVSERDKHTLETRNLEQADKAMLDKYGSDAGRVLTHRANSLGMSVDEMKAVASKNVKAFTRLMGMDGDDKSLETSSLLGGGKRSESGSSKGAEVRDSAYYSKLRKENKSYYYNPKVQMQLMKDAESMGEAFYSNS